MNGVTFHYVDDTDIFQSFYLEDSNIPNFTNQVIKHPVTRS